AVCVDALQGGATASATYGSDPATCCVPPALQPSWRRIKITLSTSIGFNELIATQEYFSCNVRIDHARTTGAGSCAGCLVPACLIFQSIKVTTPAHSGDVLVSGPTAPGSDTVTWQGSGADCSLVPVKNRTWGQVKALYR